MPRGNTYIIGFAAAVCLVCSVLVTSSAVSLKSRQEENKRLDRQKKILVLAGLMDKNAGISAGEIDKLFGDNIKAHIVSLDTGEYDTEVDAATFDQRKAAKDPGSSKVAPTNKSGIQRIPKRQRFSRVAPSARRWPTLRPTLWSEL